MLQMPCDAEYLSDFKLDKSKTSSWEWTDATCGRHSHILSCISGPKLCHAEKGVTCAVGLPQQTDGRVGELSPGPRNGSDFTVIRAAYIRRISPCFLRLPFALTGMAVSAGSGLRADQAVTTLVGLLKSTSQP